MKIKKKDFEEKKNGFWKKKLTDNAIENENDKTIQSLKKERNDETNKREGEGMMYGCDYE